MYGNIREYLFPSKKKVIDKEWLQKQPCFLKSLFGVKTEVVIPDGVTSIADGTFEYFNISSVTIPASVSNIGKKAFKGCEELVSVNILGSIVSIHEEAFHSCSKLESVTIAGKIVRISSNLFYNCKKLESFMIPLGVESIDAYAFYGCSRLSSMVIPNGVTHIGCKAFYACRKLEQVIVLGNLSVIEAEAFGNCEKLTYVDIPSSVNFIGDLAFSSCSSLEFIIIPGSIENIRKGTFKDCQLLKKVVIGEGVKNIFYQSFEDCRSLRFIAIPSSVISIQDYAFSGCHRLEKIELVNGLYGIGLHVFKNCHMLTSIEIPFSVKYLEAKVLALSSIQNIIVCNPRLDIRELDILDDVNVVRKGLAYIAKLQVYTFSYIQKSLNIEIKVSYEISIFLFACRNRLRAVEGGKFKLPRLANELIELILECLSKIVCQPSIGKGEMIGVRFPKTIDKHSQLTIDLFNGMEKKQMPRKAYGIVEKKQKTKLGKEKDFSYGYDKLTGEVTLG